MADLEFAENNFLPIACVSDIAFIILIEKPLSSSCYVLVCTFVCTLSNPSCATLDTELFHQGASLLLLCQKISASSVTEAHVQDITCFIFCWGCIRKISYVNNGEKLLYSYPVSATVIQCSLFTNYVHLLYSPTSDHWIIMFW